MHFKELLMCICGFYNSSGEFSGSSTRLYENYEQFVEQLSNFRKAAARCIHVMRLTSPLTRAS